MRRVEVTNLSKEIVTRAGRNFPPTSTTAVMVSDSGLKEVRACIHLKVVEPSSKANKPQRRLRFARTVCTPALRGGG